MHVLIAAHDVCPDPGSGGTGRYVTETASRLVSEGHDVAVLTRRRGGATYRETIRGIEVYRYDLKVAEHSAPTIAQQLPSALRRVKQCVDRVASDRSIDLLSFQGPITSALVDRYVENDTPRVCMLHSPWPTEYWIRTRENSRLGTHRRVLNANARWVLERRVLDRSDRIHTLSRFMAKKLKAVYGTAASPTVIPGGVDVERFTPNATPAERIDGDPSFLTVRRLSARMGHPLLFNAFARVIKDHPNAQLYVTGDSPLRGALETRTEHLGIGEQVTFLGYVPDADLPGAYAAADCFVLPTTDLEGFGLATTEALASGTPVIATPIGATPEILGDLRECSAFDADPLVASASPTALAQGMNAWAELSNEQRRKAGRASRRYAEEHYRWEQTVANVETNWQRTIAETGNMPADEL